MWKDRLKHYEDLLASLKEGLNWPSPGLRSKSVSVGENRTKPVKRASKVDSKSKADTTRVQGLEVQGVRAISSRNSRSTSSRSIPILETLGGSSAASSRRQRIAECIRAAPIALSPLCFESDSGIHCVGEKPTSESSEECTELNAIMEEQACIREELRELLLS